jgi:hypothetical protein
LYQHGPERRTSKEKDAAKHSLYHSDDQAPVDYELAQLGGSLVAVPSMPEEQFG